MNLLCLRREACPFTCGSDDDSHLKGIFKSALKKIEFEENLKCLFWGEHKKM